MIRRLSIVNCIKVNDISFSSTLQIGDTKKVNCHNKALAVQRGIATFQRSEGNINDYSIFHTPIELPVINEPIQSHFNHQLPIIKVNRIQITGIASSSVLHIGAINNAYMESRVKHIRHFITEPQKT